MILAKATWAKQLGQNNLAKTTWAKQNLGRTVMIATIGYRFAAAAGIATSLAAALPAGAQSLDDFYAKAKDEGAFAFYVGGPTAPWEARAKVFEERFPGIKVTIGGGFSNV